MVKYHLICFTCRKGKAIQLEHFPALPSCVAIEANKHGWIGVIDMIHTRSLVFCSVACQFEAMDNCGYYKETMRQAA